MISIREQNKTNPTKLDEKVRRVELGKVGKGDEENQNTLYKIPKELTILKRRKVWGSNSSSMCRKRLRLERDLGLGLFIGFFSWGWDKIP